MPRHVHIDPFNGVSGDMLLAALLDLGAPRAEIEAVWNGLGLPGVKRVGLEVAEKAAGGVRGLRLEITVSPKSRRTHTVAGEIRNWIEGAPLTDRYRSVALRALDRLAAAEARACGAEVEAVRFHEMGGLDTVFDLVGVAKALECLDVATATVSPIPLTRGAVSLGGQSVPCPTPATVELLRGYPVTGLELEGEIVTPTGAALVASLATPASAPPMLLEGQGAGFGRSEFPGRPNCLRLFLGTRLDGGDQGEVVSRELLVLLAANIDDLSAELLATLIDACLQAGALDAWLTPVLMKKGRPASVLQALCTEKDAWAVEGTIFRCSSTLGIRRSRVERDALARHWEDAETPWGRVRVKVGRLGDEVVNRAPEFEDCRRLADAVGVPLKEVYAAALAALAGRRS